MFKTYYSHIVSALRHWLQKLASRFRKEIEERLLALPFDVFAIGIVALTFCWLEGYLKGSQSAIYAGSVLAILMAVWLFLLACAILVTSPLAMYIKRVCGMDTSFTASHMLQVRKYCDEVFMTCQQEIDSVNAVVYEKLWQLTSTAQEIELYAKARGELGGVRIVQSVEQHCSALKRFAVNARPYSMQEFPEPETTLRFVIANSKTPSEVVEEATRLLAKIG